MGNVNRLHSINPEVFAHAHWNYTQNIWRRTLGGHCKIPFLRSTTPRNHRAGDRQHWPASECAAYIPKLQQTWSDFLNPSTSWKIRNFTAPTCLNFAVKMFTGMYKFFCQKFLRMKCGILDLKIGCHSGFSTCSSIVALCMQRYCVMIPDSGNVSEVWNVGWRTPAGGRTLIGLLYII